MVLRTPLHLLWTEFLVNLTVIIIKFAEGDLGPKMTQLTVSGEQATLLKLGHLVLVTPCRPAFRARATMTEWRP